MTLQRDLLRLDARMLTSMVARPQLFDSMGMVPAISQGGRRRRRPCSGRVRMRAPGPGCARLRRPRGPTPKRTVWRAFPTFHLCSRLHPGSSPLILGRGLLGVPTLVRWTLPLQSGWLSAQPAASAGRRAGQPGVRAERCPSPRLFTYSVIY